MVVSRPAGALVGAKKAIWFLVIWDPFVNNAIHANSATWSASAADAAKAGPTLPPRGNLKPCHGGRRGRYGTA